MGNDHNGVNMYKVLCALFVIGCNAPAARVRLGPAVGDTGHPTETHPTESAPTDTGESTPPCEPVMWYLDADADGWGSTGIESCDVPAGAASVGGDCDDTDAAAHPEAAEACNGRDDDCDGEADEGVTVTAYQDADGDGYGADAAVVCDPTGYARVSGDCDDAQSDIYPGAAEVYDDVDQDCDPATEGDACAVVGGSFAFAGSGTLTEPGGTVAASLSGTGYLCAVTCDVWWLAASIGEGDACGPVTLPYRAFDAQLSVCVSSAPADGVGSCAVTTSAGDMVVSAEQVGGMISLSW